MLAATMDYDPAHQRPQHYTEDLSIEEFIGSPGRQFKSSPPVLRYHHETDSYVKKSSGKRIVGRSMSVDSAQRSSCSGTQSSLAKERLGSHSGSPASFKSLDPSGFLQPPRSTPPPRGVRREVSCETQAVDIVDLPINSNPIIEENTGFHGDSQLPFFTPSSSIDEDRECFEGGGGNGGVAPQDGPNRERCGNGREGEEAEHDDLVVAALQTNETSSAKQSPSVSVQQ